VHKIKQVSRAWIEAVVAFDKDSRLNVLCPECQGSFLLQILDCDLNCKNPSEGFE
jgi:hypothetical protein